MDYIKKLLQALIDTLVPPGTIIMFGGTQVPDGYILVQNVKVYQDEFPRLYPILAACTELEKGNDSGRAWVKMVNPDGRVPQFTTSGSLVWQLLEASLPNIFGEASLETMFGLLHNSAIVSGVFEKGQHFSNAIDGSSGSSYSMMFSAAKGNSLYNGDKVQTAALQSLCCIKT